MTVITKGFYLELINKNTGRIVFSASTDEIKKEVFDELWTRIGDQVFHGDDMDKCKQQYFEVRLSPVAG